VRVLVVDDEPDIRRLMSHALTAQGITVDTAPDGDAALHQLDRQAYDLMLLDVLMPGTSGVDLLPALFDRHPQQRVMMISAINEPRVRVKCLESGAVDYLAKPFVLAELVARVRVHARRDLAQPGRRTERRQQERRSRGRRATDPLPPPPEGEDPDRYLRTPSLTLDLQARRARSGSQDIGLSERETLVLAHLLRRAGEVCPRLEILDEVWGRGTGQSSNVVDVYVGRLRSKLPEGTITTVRHAGYLFHA
jgi:two-component system OmpR family response regulator